MISCLKKWYPPKGKFLQKKKKNLQRIKQWIIIIRPPPRIVKNVIKSHSNIVTQLELQARVCKTTERQPFITIKDHKDNYINNPSCRLIDPSKPEIGRISQQITARINSIIREKTGYKQWQNTNAVIKWFKIIENKKNNKIPSIWRGEFLSIYFCWTYGGSYRMGTKLYTHKWQWKENHHGI